MYAVFNVGLYLCDTTVTKDLTSGWFVAVKLNVPNVFDYALFFIAWTWSARHFRSHWHNFIVNSYRHRALWRYEQIENRLFDLAAGVGKKTSDKGVEETVRNLRDNVAPTILELYRLSGVLLLLPGDTSYLDAGKDEHAMEEIVKIEEIIKSAVARDAGRI